MLSDGTVVSVVSVLKEVTSSAVVSCRVVVCPVCPVADVVEFSSKVAVVGGIVTIATVDMEMVTFIVASSEL